MTEIAPTTLYVGPRDAVIAEVGGLTHIYEGKFLLQPDGDAAYDAEGADTKKGLKELIAYYKTIYPTVAVVWL